MGYDGPGEGSFKIPVSDTQAYKQFGNSVVVPVFTAVAKLMVPRVLEANEARSTSAGETTKKGAKVAASPKAKPAIAKKPSAKKPAAKKPAAKKPAAKKPAAKKPAAKKPAAKKPAAKKPAAKKPVRASASAKSKRKARVG